MKRITFLTVVAVLITLVAASCGQNVQKVEPVTDETHCAYIKFDGKTLLVDELVWVSYDDDELIEKYGIDRDEMYDDYEIINEVEQYEEWKLLPNATFSVVRYVKSEEEGVILYPDVFEVSRDEFINSRGGYPVLITGSRSGVSCIREMYIP